MTQIKYTTIPTEYIEKIRREKKDDFGHAVEFHTATEAGYGPCRSCLRQFKPGETRLLFSYAPVNSNNPYNEVGPVYIHDRCEPYAKQNEFPEEVKHGRLHIPLLLRCYNTERRMIDAVPVHDNDEVELLIGKLFERPEIAFVHIRNAEAQCFIAQAARVELKSR